MIINDKFVFIHNPRTGGAFVRNFFKKAFPDSSFLKLNHYHLPISALEQKHRHKLKFGMVRNPWSWYVSLYHFQQPKGKWLCLCSPNKTPTFKEFVTTLLSREFAKEHKHLRFYPVGNPEAPPEVPVFKNLYDLDIGLFTYRYIYLFTYECQDILSGKANIFKEHSNLISLDRVLKTEELPNNIIKLFDNRGIRMSGEDKKLWKSQPKRNYTQHKPYKNYYDQELIELVRYKDRLIIDQYGYEF